MLGRIGFLGIFIEHGSTSPGSNRVHTSMFTGVMSGLLAVCFVVFYVDFFSTRDFEFLMRLF